MNKRGDGTYGKSLFFTELQCRSSLLRLFVLLFCEKQADLLTGTFQNGTLHPERSRAVNCRPVFLLSVLERSKKSVF
jgi:hypothetical protein